MWSRVEEAKSDGGTTDEEGLTHSGRRRFGRTNLFYHYENMPMQIY